MFPWWFPIIVAVGYFCCGCMVGIVMTERKWKRGMDAIGTMRAKYAAAGKVECPHCNLWVTSLRGHFEEHPMLCGCHAKAGVLL